MHVTRGRYSRSPIALGKHKGELSTTRVSVGDIAPIQDPVWMKGQKSEYR
jgi:hypothetical protein